MAVLERIAYYQNRRNELPNQLLAKELAETRNMAGIREITSNLENRNKNIRSDCLKVLYEIGYLDPELISDFIGIFLILLQNKDNRMVWGAMIALATVAGRHPKEIWEQVDEILRITETGTVITMLWGIRVLAKVAAADRRYKEKILPFLLKYLQNCLPRDLPIHTESILCALDQRDKAGLSSILESRRIELTPAQLVRLNRVQKLMNQI